MVSARHSEVPPFRRAAIPKGPPFSATYSSDNLRLGIRLGLGLGFGSVVWLWQYQELFRATTMNDGFQNGGLFGMAALRYGGPELFLRRCLHLFFQLVVRDKVILGFLSVHVALH